MATQKYVAGTIGLTWATAGFSTELNSLASGNAVMAASALDNSSNLDLFFDLSISLGSVTSGANAPYIGIYLYPLNQDGTSYGDGKFGSAAAGPPAATYFVGTIIVPASTTAVMTGMIQGIPMPPASFKLVLYNGAGVAMAASSNTVKYRTYNYAVA
jgi:hypothetical protein